MSTTCKACNGKRTYEVHTYKLHGGVRCGSEITLLYPCETCKGRGSIDCVHCNDTGWMPEVDYATGEYEGDRPCDYCTRGRIIAETQAIDAEKEAWEATRPDYRELHEARMAAGEGPF